jgi:hypothetical protein
VGEETAGKGERNEGREKGKAERGVEVGVGATPQDEMGDKGGFRGERKKEGGEKEG